MAVSTSADTPTSVTVLRDCRLLDLSSGSETVGDIAIVDGEIDAIGQDLALPTGGESIPIDGQYVIPGLVDIHAHVFHGVGESVHPDDACLGRGTVLAVDAGTAGSATIDAFRTAVGPYATEVRAWLNLATIGLVDTSVGELIPGPYLNPDEAVAAARRHPGFVVGIKARLSSYAAGQGARRVLAVLRDVADELRLPVMVHVGDTQESLPDILEFLRPGDVVTHALTGRRHGIMSGAGDVLSDVRDAQARGVIFDSARGRNHLSFEVLARAVAQGFLPDTLSTDMSSGMSGDPGYGMATLGNYLLAHGIPLHQVLARMTIAPAAVIGRRTAPVLAPGAPADLTVLRLDSAAVVMEDVDGRRLHGTSSMTPTATVRAGAHRRIPDVLAGQDASDTFDSTTRKVLQ